MGYADLRDFYRRGPYAPLVIAQRAAGSAAVPLVHVAQGPGDYPDAATPSAWLGLKLRGSGRHQIDLGAGRWQGRCEAGEMVLVPPGTPTVFRQDAAGEFLFTALPAEGGEPGFEPPEDFGRLHARPFRDPLIEALVRRVWDQAAPGSARDALFADSALRTLVLALANLAKGVAEDMAAGPTLAGWRLRRCLDHIEAQLAGEVTLDDLAAVAQLSPVYFARQFRRATGQPPHQYVLGRRIAAAKRLLAEGDMPIAELALACGFCSQEHLTHRFRRSVGTTPAAFRRSARG